MPRRKGREKPAFVDQVEFEGDTYLVSPILPHNARQVRRWANRAMEHGWSNPDDAGETIVHEISHGWSTGQAFWVGLSEVEDGEVIGVCGAHGRPRSHGYVVSLQKQIRATVAPRNKRDITGGMSEGDFEILRKADSVYRKTRSGRRNAQRGHKTLWQRILDQDT